MPRKSRGSVPNRRFRRRSMGLPRPKTNFLYPKWQSRDLHRYRMNQVLGELMRNKYKKKMSNLPIFESGVGQRGLVPNYKFDKAMSKYQKWSYWPYV